jgi:hypothetical protein
MTHVCCPSCRLRFTPAAASYVTNCPHCGEAPREIADPGSALGFRLLGPEDLPFELSWARPEAVPSAGPVTRS